MTIGSRSPESQYITAISSKKQKRSRKVATSVVSKLGIAIKVLKERTFRMPKKNVGSKDVESRKKGTAEYSLLMQCLDFDQEALTKDSGIIKKMVSWKICRSYMIFPSNLHLIQK